MFLLWPSRHTIGGDAAPLPWELRFQVRSASHTGHMPQSRSQTGACIGGIIFPIMLNQLLFHRGVRFSRAVRDSAFVVLGLLIAANVLMRDRKGVTRSALPRPDLRTLFTDRPYMISIVGCARLPWHRNPLNMSVAGSLS